MALTKKTLQVIAITFVGLIIVLYTGSSFILLRSFSSLEEEDVLENVRRAEMAIEAALTDLSQFTGDYAWWDDTYTFIEDRNEAYVKSNVVASTFTEPHINFILFVNATGEIVLARAYSLQADEAVAVPEALLEQIFPGAPLIRHENLASNVKGFLMLPAGPAMVASRPILTSEGEGPIRGALIMGRYLNEEELAGFSELTGLELALAPLTGVPIPEDLSLAAARIERSPEDDAVVVPRSDEAIAGYTILHDLYDRPILVLRAEQPRQIYRQGRSTLRYLMLTIILTGAVFSVVTLLLLKRVVLSRLSMLSAGVASINDSHKLEQRLNLPGDDELSDLGNTINEMLETLEGSQQELWENEARYHAVVDQSIEAIFLLDLSTKRFIEVNPACQHFLGYTSGELPQMTLYDVSEYPDEAVNRDILETLANGQNKIGERHYRTKKGNLVTAEVSANPVIYEGKEVLCFNLHDITERKAAEVWLRKSEERFRQMAENIQDGLTIIEDGQIVYVNDQLCEIFGRSREVLMTMKNVLLFAAPEERPRLKTLMNEGADGTLITDLEFWIVRADGSRRCIHNRYSWMRREEGELIGRYIVTSDVTARKLEEEAQQALIERMQRQHRTLVKLNTHPALIEGQLDYALPLIMQAAAKALNVNRVSFLQFTPDRQRLLRCNGFGMDNCWVENQATVENYPEYFAALDQGMVLAVNDVDQTAHPTPWRQATLEAPVRRYGEIVGIVCHEDESSRRTWEPDELTFASQIAGLVAQALLNAEVRRRTAHLEALNSVIAAAAAAPNVENLLETALEETLKAVGLSGGAIWAGELSFSQEIQAETVRPLLQGKNVAQRYPLALDDVTTTTNYPRGWLSTTLPSHVRAILATPIGTAGSQLGGLILISPTPHTWTEEEAMLIKAVGHQLGNAVERLQLVRALRRQASELSAAVQKLQELDRLKTEFIQNVSHELRTPLALIRGYAEILESGELGVISPDQSKPVKIIARRSRMLSELVEGISLILEAQVNPPTPQPLSLAALAREAIEDFHVQVEEQGLRLVAEIAPDLPHVAGDPTYLRRVLDNLLGNAFKFTPEGGEIGLRVWQESEACVVLQVHDSGIGIPKEQQARIFERFYQVDGSPSRKYGGVGLGLALVKEIITIFGGSVSVESEVDVGTTFTITLPTVA